MVYDFHSHTFLSDGVLSPVELIRRAEVAGYAAIAITDHIAIGNLDNIIPALVHDCVLAMRHWQIRALPGVELTHVPPEEIDELAQQAKQLGAKLVLVHGETVSEPVFPGTNLAALSSRYVDVLAHPGLLTAEEAQLAAKNGIFLELSARKGNALANGLVARLAIEAGAKLLVNSDAHEPGDLMSESFQIKVAQGAGLAEDEIMRTICNNPHELLSKVAKS